jgi:hypothetical protein
MADDWWRPAYFGKAASAVTRAPVGHRMSGTRSTLVTLNFVVLTYALIELHVLVVSKTMTPFELVLAVPESGPKTCDHCDADVCCKWEAVRN